MRVILAQPARAARSHALAHCASEAAMVRLLRRFDAAEGLLGRFPEMGREGQRAGSRELVLSGTPYVFIYRVGQRAVTILDIRDSRRGS